MGTIGWTNRISSVKKYCILNVCAQCKDSFLLRFIWEDRKMGDSEGGITKK